MARSDSLATQFKELKMKNFMSIYAGLILSLIMIGCAHHRDVRPGADGINHVVVRAAEQESAERQAIDQANHYCKEELQKSAVFVNEESKYTGDMDEKTRKTVRNASKAAGVVGGSMGVFGGRSERQAGNVIGGAGAVGAIMTGDDAYTADMKFKCR